MAMTKAELEAAVPTAIAEAPPRKTKVAVLGFTDSWKLAPFNDPEFEIWGLNELYQFIPRWDRWFDIHARGIYENDRNRVHDHILKLRAMTCPIYMQQHWDDIPNSVPYPLQEIAKAFPNPCPDARPYLTNSITYMILLALLEGFQELHVYGVDMAHDTEYSFQKPSCEWAVGIVQGKGIKLYIPHESDLIKTNFLYGFEADAAHAFDRKLAARKSEMDRKIAELDQQIANLNEARAQYRGAVQDTEHIMKNWKSH